jgi:hypothetical protein
MKNVKQIIEIVGGFERLKHLLDLRLHRRNVHVCQPPRPADASGQRGVSLPPVRPDAAETIKLAESIINDLTSSNGQRFAFAQNRRYVSLDALRKAKKTSELGEE